MAPRIGAAQGGGPGPTGGGALLTILAGFTGPPPLVGVVALCAEIALLDAVDRGGISRRQVTLFLFAFGAVVGAWALVVTVLLALLGLPTASPALGLLAASILAVGGAVYPVRYAPQGERSGFDDHGGRPGGRPHPPAASGAGPGPEADQPGGELTTRPDP